jgi:hypothetical protein
MRRLVLFPLFALLLLAGCSDAIGISSRTVDGDWTARVDGETIWVTLREDNRGRITGAGEWGWSEVYVSGDRQGSEVYLMFEFDRFSPVTLEGTLRGREIDGRLRGSGYNQRITLRRD